MTLQAGTKLGSFEIVGQLGVGGMGEVYRATDTKLGREVAIKTLPAALASDRDRLARFEREAKLLASLKHAHIAAVHSLDEHAGTLYIAMELIEGETLEAKLKAGALPIEDTLRIALQIAAALEAAHDKGVVHRDLKPANIMLTANNEVKVLDFGLAKAFAGDPSQAKLAHSPALSAAMTQQGLILGTAGYMSPEQASGQATDQRADVWAFGVVLYEMLTGLPLFSGESVPHVLADVLKTEPDWKRLPKNLHPRLRQALERCLEKKVRNRYHSIADVRIDIEKALSDPKGSTIVASEARPLWRRAAPAAAAALLVGAVLASLYFITLEQPVAPPEPSAPLPVSRFVITPPATAPLASQNPHDVAISRDGKRIVYVAQNVERNTVELHVRELDALESRPLPGTESDSVGAMPFFSPDGRSIGYFAGVRGVLSVGVDSRPSAKLLDAPEAGFVGASWGPDNTLVYSTWTRLQRGIASGGGTPQPLTVERPGSGFVAAPVLLPGGRAVLFVDIDGGTEHVAVLDLATGEEKRLLQGGTVVYSETGHIVFGRGTTLMAAPFNVAELAVTGEPVAVLQGVRDPGPGTATDFDLSANGTLVYVPAPSDAESGSMVVWVDRTGTELGRAVSELVNNPRDPRLSPDGTRLLLVTGSPGADGELWSYDLSGRPPIPLALPGDNIFPVWRPDSRQVAFARAEGVSTTVFVLPADGSVLTPQPLASGTITAPKVWSATDELILIEAPLGPMNFDIVARPVGAADDVRQIVATEFTEFDPALSPNGRWLAYVSNRTGRDEIWVQGYPDGVALRVSTNGGYEPRWSADGRELYYLQGNAMMAVAAETEGEFSFAAPQQLFAGSRLAASGPFASSYDVARDGRFLMIEPPGTSGDATPASIVVVENWAEELKRLVPTQ
jgi:Tol biopolymer transport system component